MDELGTAAAAVTVSRTALELVGFVKDRVQDAEMISALFDVDGERVTGDERLIATKVLSKEHPTEWWYRMASVPGYTLIPMAAQPEALPLFAHDPARGREEHHFRWVAPVAPGRIYGDRPENFAVDFIVVGFRPDALVRYLAG